MEECKVVYISGAYSCGETCTEEEKLMHLKEMDEWAVKLWNKGYATIHPIRNDSCVKGITTYEEIIERDLVILSHCDAIFICPSWYRSQGAMKEYLFAQEHKKEIIFYNEI